MARKSRRPPQTRRAPVRVAAKKKPAAKAPPQRGFVGRESSPVLDKYPAKPGAPPKPAPIVPAAVISRPPPPSDPTAPAPAASNAPSAAPTGPAPIGLISLDRPFDVDEFSQSLGETLVRVVVPREDLPEILRRVLDFMGFGIYVYAIRVSPEDSDTLRRFVVELQRVDYSTARRTWVPFEDKGRADSPFGPGAPAP